MVIRNINEMKEGWFIGDFNPSVFKTSGFEIAYKTHRKNSICAHHYHKQVLEINLLVRGRMEMQGQILSSGDIFIMSPWEISNPKFLEDCEIVTVKMPSVPTDKYIIPND